MATAQTPKAKAPNLWFEIRSFLLWPRSAGTQARKLERPYSSNSSSRNHFLGKLQFGDHRELLRGLGLSLLRRPPCAKLCAPDGLQVPFLATLSPLRRRLYDLLTLAPKFLRSHSSNRECQNLIPSSGMGEKRYEFYKH